jgi:integrase/recombinase XerD
MTTPTVGQLVHSFVEDHLKTQKGLRPLSVKSYADVLRLFLGFVAADARRKITRLSLEELTFERVLRFLRHLEVERHNHAPARNQRLACLHTFFEYLGRRVPEMLSVAERVAAIPRKRVPLPETRFLEREEVSALFGNLPARGCHAMRDRALLLFLYNTGARVQEVADLRVGDLELVSQPRVRLHGKGDKWRSCPLWEETARQLRRLLEERGTADRPQQSVFASRSGRALTGFGIHKIVRRHAARLETSADARSRKISPHVFRHTTAVHLLEAGVEVNVIRGWLGHASLLTTNRYAEINARAKEAALRVCEPPPEVSAAFPRRAVRRDDPALLQWLGSL